MDLDILQKKTLLSSRDCSFKIEFYLIEIY